MRAKRRITGLTSTTIGMNTVKLSCGALALVLTTVAAVTLTRHAYAEDWSLPQLMAALAEVKTVHTSFDETKTMAMLSEPIKSSGTLAYKAPDFLEKRVKEPQPSYFIVAGDQVTVSVAPNEERQLVLFQYPALDAFVAALRGTLAGDLKTLKEYYDVEFSGSRDNWRMRLVPSVEEMRLYVKDITIHGNGAHITRLITLEPNNDASTMTFYPAGE